MVLSQRQQLPKSEIIIVGGGLAGISVALKCAEFANVRVYFKTKRHSSASAWAQGGIAAVQSQDDTFASHQEDTVSSGYGLCHESIVKKCVQDGPLRLEELKSLGIQFNTDLHREAGHHASRIAHIADHTGRSVMEQLLKCAEQHPSITIYEHHYVIDVIQDMEGRVNGVYVLEKSTGHIHSVPASAVVLATGGAGKVYTYTSNPPEACGDGIAIALRAGCAVSNMEFFQFHPTLLYHPKAASQLITEALRGAGAHLLTLKEERFTDELLPRDQVARAIDREMKESASAHVWLDCRHIPELELKFPHITQTCRAHGIDPVAQLIPVVPGAHYCCGGVVVDVHGATSVPGLYAVGEISHTGLHGANRLASNSLLEALVFAHEVAQKCRHENNIPTKLPEWDFGLSKPLKEEIRVSHCWAEIRRAMSDFVGIVRSDERLQRAKTRLDMIEAEINTLYWTSRPTVPLLELRNLSLVARIITSAAMKRIESRGLHANSDHPETREIFRGEFHCRLDAFERFHWNWTGLPPSK